MKNMSSTAARKQPKKPVSWGPDERRLFITSLQSLKAQQPQATLASLVDQAMERLPEDRRRPWSGPLSDEVRSALGETTSEGPATSPDPRGGTVTSIPLSSVPGGRRPRKKTKHKLTEEQKIDVLRKQ